MSSVKNITAMGFWFPVGSPEFFRARDEFSPDYPLIAQANSTVDISTQLDEEVLPEDLQASVYRRLVTVAKDKGYTQAIPVFPRVNLTFGAKENEPAMVVLTCDTFESTWPASMKALVMIVHSRGLYLWLAVHDKISEIDPKAEEAVREAVREALAEHIYDIVGGDYRSRLASLDNDVNTIASTASLGDDRTLQIYRTDHIGILPFFQINTIFEALNNSAFNPAVFFERPKHEHKQTVNKKDRYSLGEFIRSITTLTAVGDDDTLTDEVKQKVADNQPNRDLTTKGIADKLLQLTAPTSSIKDKLEIADQLRDDCLTSTVQHDLLRQFMRITSTNSLRIMKSRIERCSRILLSEMLEIAHRHEPLIQTEPPDFDDSIKGVNSAQLRSFIRYFASKMPLIKNIERSLSEALDREDINRDSINPDSANGNTVKRDNFNSALFENLEALHAGWTQFVHGIDDDLQGLERAITQRRQDQLLREEERARSEQETVAELERVEKGSGQRLLGETDPTVNIVSNVISIIAVIFGIVVLFQTSSIKVDSFVLPPNRQTISAIGYIIGVVLLGFLVNIAMHALVRLGVRIAARRRREMEPQSDHFYYEVDVQLNMLMTEPHATGLLEVGSQLRTRQEQSKERRKVRHHHGPEPLPYNMYRNSYRGERISHDETVHKVYVAADVCWGETKRVDGLRGRWRPTRSHDMRLYVIYEILFHRPSGAESYLFQSLRVISTHDAVLSTQQLTDLKRLIINDFVNPYVGQPLHADGDHFDALMTLNMFFPKQNATPETHQSSPVS